MIQSSLLFIFLAGFTSFGCSSSTSGSSSGTSGSSGSSGSTPVSQSDCNSACTAKATQCGASAAEGQQGCAGVCTSATQGQVSCLQAKSCGELSGGQNFEQLCPKDTGSSGSSGSSGTSGSSGSGGGSKALGDACTCANVSSGSEGLCSGTSEECASGLSCIYASGSSGKGKCYASSCCETTTDCDKDKSKLLACSSGTTCTRTGIGWYCGK